MKKEALIVITLSFMCVVSGCGAKEKADPAITGGADEPPAIILESDHDEDKKENETAMSGAVTDEQAITAIRNYCKANNPDLDKIEKDGEYQIYWEVVSSDEKEIVVLFRSYTGAQIRYYINAKTGDTYVTEFVPGITPEEERTDESFNIRDYYT